MREERSKLNNHAFSRGKMGSGGKINSAGFLAYKAGKARQARGKIGNRYTHLQTYTHLPCVPVPNLSLSLWQKCVWGRKL